MPPLSFLAPWFLVGAAAAAVPVVLHLFARETASTVPFSAVHLIEPTPVEQTRRRRVTELILLALRMAILVLLALAFARPYLPAGITDQRLPLTIVALDVSASMGAPATWALARQRAYEAIDAAPPGRLVALAVFSGDARTVVDPTTDRQAMREALGGLAPGAGPTRFGSVLELARGLSGGRQTELVVVSDFPASIAAESRRLWLNDGMGLRLERIAPPAADLRVVSLRRTDTGVAALVEAEGAGRRESVVSLVLDGRESGRRVVPFEAGGVVEVAFDADLPAAGVLSVRVQDPGGRPAGDERFLVLDPRPPLRVLVIQPVGTLPEASLYVREALAAEPSGAFSTEVRRANDPTLGVPDWTESTSAVVLLGTRGIDRRARDQVTEFARRGGGILIAAGASTEALAVRDLLGREITIDAQAPGDEFQEAHLVVAASRHPLVEPFGERAAALGEVRLGRATPLVAPEESVVLRLSSGGPALVEGSVGSGRVIVFASDLSGEWNDFPKHAAFVPFISEAVRFAARMAGEPDTLEVADAAGADWPGVASVGSPPRRVAVNVAAEEFGQPALDPARVEQMVVRRAVELPPIAEARDEEGRAPTWRIVILAALALLVVEGVVAAARGGGMAGVTS